LGPTSTVVTLSIGYTLMNTFLVESIFNWPGIGRYVASSVISMDFPASVLISFIPLHFCIFILLWRQFYGCFSLV
jgi:peptide/nickel transport system permease protein